MSTNQKNRILGFQNVTTIKHFSLMNTSPHDCSKYSRMGEADIHCAAANSTFEISHPELLVGDKLELTEFLPTTSVTSANSSPTKLPSNGSKSELKTGAPFIAAVVILPVLAISIIVFLCIWRRHRAKKKSTLTYPQTSELEPRERIPKAELAVLERPGELCVDTGNSSSIQRVSELSAQIIDAKVIEPHPFLDRNIRNIGSLAPDLDTLPVQLSVDIKLREEEDKKLEVLKTKLDNVRNERERLSRMQELEELESALQEEVMAKQRSEIQRGT